MNATTNDRCRCCDATPLEMHRTDCPYNDEDEPQGTEDFASPHYVSSEDGPGGCIRLSFNIRVF